MSAEIIAKLGLSTARFDQGLTSAERGWEAFSQKLRRTPIQIVPQKSARESAQVFEEIEAARREHQAAIDRTALQTGLNRGPGAIADGPVKSAADSARVFEESLRRQEQRTQELAQATEALATARKRTAYDEATTVGRMKIVQGELVTLARQREQHARGTVERARAELQIEERLSRLRALQRTQAASNMAGLPTVAAVERRANGIMAVLRRKFGAGDVFRDSLRSVGAAGVGGIVASITSHFSRSADKAAGIEATSAGNFDSLKNTLSTLGGMATRIRLNNREVRDLGQQIDMTAKTLRELEGNPLNLIHPLWQQQVDKVQTELNELIGKQNRLGHETIVLGKELEYQNDQYASTLSSARASITAQLNGAGALRRAALELFAAESKLHLARIHQRPPEEIRALELQLKIQQGAVKLQQRANTQAGRDLAQTLAGQAVSGTRTFANGQARPRTETERLADRAARSREEASEAVLTGQPQRARDSLRSARRDEGSVTQRLSSATRLVARDQRGMDTSALKTELVNTNALLKSIDNSLRPTAVKILR